MPTRGHPCPQTSGWAYDRGFKRNPNWSPSLLDTRVVDRTRGCGGAGSVSAQLSPPSCRVANRELRRGGGFWACTLVVVSLGGATFAITCSRKLEKTSSAASVTPTPTDCVCAPFSISCKCVGSVMDSKCVPILRRNLSLLVDRELGFVTAAPDCTLVFMAFT